MEYAFENPKRADGAERQIMQAVKVAARATGYSYNVTRKEYRVDPKTGRLIQR